MTSETFNLYKTKQDIGKLKTLLKLLWKCCSAALKIRSAIFSFQWHFNNGQGCREIAISADKFHLTRMSSFFLKFYRSDDIQKLKAWPSPHLWKNNFCKLIIERARALQILITFFTHIVQYATKDKCLAQIHWKKTLFLLNLEVYWI